MPTKGKRWVELWVEADRGSADDIVAFMGRYCQGGAVIEDRSFVDTRVGEGWAEELSPSQRSSDTLSDGDSAGPLGGGAEGGRVTVKGYLPVEDEETRQKLEIALLLLGRTSPISEPHWRILEPEEWAESWKAFFPPQRIGQSTVIVPTWHDYQPLPGDDIIIRLDPGMAFGTGLHATTRLCLLAVERLMQPGWRVLDVGTGSGILAIAAAKSGASQVDAIDSDPLAVEAALENAERNGVADVIAVSQTTLEGALSPRLTRHDGSDYDLLLVNILAEIIAAMAPAIAAALRPGGLWVASGIIAERESLATEALQAAGLTLDDRLQQEDWVALLGHK
jgi:ribosomal protein L11 methyltransferase